MAQIKDLERMCGFYDNCLECRVYKAFETCGVCFLPDNLDEIVDNWVKEHPAKTCMQDFFEKFPNAPKEDNGTPIPCIIDIYGVDMQLKECLESNVDCLKCWNQEMKGERNER